MKKKPLIVTIVIAILIALLIVYSIFSGKEKEVILETEVQKGRFDVTVVVTGELQALNETEIDGPYSLRSRSLRIRSVKIQDLIPEGTVVDSGDWVATLDRSEADNALKDVMEDLERLETALMRAKLDTTIEMRRLRDELINLRFTMEEAKITLEQSKYEPPATIRQAEINQEKAERAYEQARQNYALRVRQARGDIREAELNLMREQRRMRDMEEVLKQFDITAPAPGMVIYKREWNGEKRTAGSEINSWDLTVATLPDLSTMISRTYVNEIDISKIRRSQMVAVGVDAFPEKQYTGEVIEVANIGEQLPNTDAKVFEVRIRLNERDSILRPSMTTSNNIITKVYVDVMYLPLEAVHANDSLTFVYTKGKEKRVVVLGESNQNSIIIEQGLSKGDVVYLSSPKDLEGFSYSGLELMEIIRERELEKKRQQEQEQQVQPRNRSKERPASGQIRRNTES
ncbi:MAG: efflux RND transporter periplasmic adaptor subunit [Bacteroidales bacterium]